MQSRFVWTKVCTDGQVMRPSKEANQARAARFSALSKRLSIATSADDSLLKPDCCGHRQCQREWCRVWCARGRHPDAALYRSSSRKARKLPACV